jgi:hypothetical protein
MTKDFPITALQSAAIAELDNAARLAGRVRDAYVRGVIDGLALPAGAIVTGLTNQLLTIELPEPPQAQ